ncbi:hypothetical protein LTR97_010648 [Elasticomyces elasticus]|uniref:Uncharacterized protein n=1 Tax=Elasticomyces elasticus TaxID=574655 RepID=A0AAN7VNN8_9PEZI|nr:hypothetical protein LTR97_010648 [Elasticomyces elasticus]
MGLAYAMGAALAAPLADDRAFLNIKNNCPQTVYIVYSNEQYKSASATLSSGKGLGIILSGLGYSVGLSKDPNFYSTSVPKLILGYSVNSDQDLIYYSLAPDFGNPLQGQSVSIAGDGCPSVNSADGKTYACAVTRALTYTLCG